MIILVQITSDRKAGLQNCMCKWYLTDSTRLDRNLCVYKPCKRMQNNFLLSNIWGMNILVQITSDRKAGLQNRMCKCDLTESTPFIDIFRCRRSLRGRGTCPRARPPHLQSRRVHHHLRRGERAGRFVSRRTGTNPEEALVRKIFSVSGSGASGKDEHPGADVFKLGQEPTLKWNN